MKVEFSIISEVLYSEEFKLQFIVKVVFLSVLSKLKFILDKGNDDDEKEGLDSWWDWIMGYINKVWNKIIGGFKDDFKFD